MPRSRSRKVGTRRQAERVLIVTEGRKTEPAYLRDLCAAYNLGSVEITGRSRSNPLDVAEYGLRAFEDDGDYDRLYCVFDRDTSTEFAEAVRLLRDFRRDEGWNVYGTYSIPCFEYWILLHYEQTGRRFAPPGSPCDDVIARLEDHHLDRPYAKTATGLFATTHPHLNDALARARQRMEATRGLSLDDWAPRTKMHRLVEALRGLRAR